MSALHAAALVSIAVAQPLFAVIGAAPDFLLAHDLGPSEILTLASLVGIGAPLAAGALAAAAARLHPMAGRVTMAAVVASAATLVVLQASRNLPIPPWPLVGAAAIAGAAASFAYARFELARAFTTWLVPALVVIPLAFVLRPGIQSLLRANDSSPFGQAASGTPVVLVVFDGLPLSALLDETHEIDREAFPSFARLASQATWFRNATTVSDYTRWALPAILSGRFPAAASLPTAADHKNTLFTLLGASHRVHVLEPLSRLCPQSLCDYGGAGLAEELAAFAPTLVNTYLHTVVPAGLEDRLPPVDLGWAEGVPPSEEPGRVWLQGGAGSRRGEVLEFVEGIAGQDDRPPLYFMHVLLPHTPLVYLPNGQRYGTDRHLPGLLDTRDRWVEDDWAVTQGYRRLLLQARYVDSLLGRILEQLENTGLFDASLVIVASDHGASFRPGGAFRRLTDDNYMDILPVPLLMKLPWQRAGQISDRNVETIDILPTIADVLNIPVPWPVDGTSALLPGGGRAVKTAYHDQARHRRLFDATLLEATYEWVERKMAMFGRDDNPNQIPINSPRYELIGRDVGGLRVRESGNDIEFAVLSQGDYSDVDPDGRFVPAHLIGRARWRGRRRPAVVAVAVNKKVRATTRTYPFPQYGLTDVWSVVLPPDAFREGDNEIEIFVVGDGDTPVLHRAHFSHARPVDLLSDTAAFGLQVEVEGFHDREGNAQRSIRWTSGAAKVVVPPEARIDGRAVRVTLASAGPTEKGLVMRINGCEVFEGRVPATRWSRIFPIPDCRGDEGETVIEFYSFVHPDPADQERSLGVAVEGIEMLEDEWPPAVPLPPTAQRSHLRLNVEGGQTIDSRATLTAALTNRGDGIWATPSERGSEQGAVRIGVLWFREGETERSSALQRVELPQTMVPGDTVEFQFQLVPNGDDGTPLATGAYDVSIGLLQEGVGWFTASGDSARRLRVIHDARP